MPTTLELCEKYFATNDIYKLMNLTKDALEKDGKHLIFFVLCSLFDVMKFDVFRRMKFYCIFVRIYFGFFN